MDILSKVFVPQINTFPTGGQIASIEG